jgi:hypothetical protein
MRKELQGLEEFERAVREEVQISSDIDLPLCALSLRLPDGSDVGLTRRLLDEIRSADLVTAGSSDELAIVLPNTTLEDVRRVEQRLREVSPEAAMGLVAYEPADTQKPSLITPGRAAGKV